MALSKSLVVSAWMFLFWTGLAGSRVNPDDAKALCKQIVLGQDAITCAGIGKGRVVLVTNASLMYTAAQKELEDDWLDLGGRVPKKLNDILPADKSIPEQFSPKFVINDNMNEHIGFFSTLEQFDTTTGILNLNNPKFIDQMSHSEFDIRFKWLSSNESFTVYSVNQSDDKYWIFKKHSIRKKTVVFFDFIQVNLNSGILYLCFQSSSEKQVFFSQSKCPFPVGWPISTGFFSSRKVYIIGTNLQVYIFAKKAFDEPATYSSYRQVSFSSFFGCSPHSHLTDILLILSILGFIFCLFGPLSLCVYVHVFMVPGPKVGKDLRQEEIIYCNAVAR